jgi:hypothetical protein
MRPPFYDQRIIVAPQAIALGGSYTFDLPRESRIRRMDLFIDGTVGTAANVAAIEGLPRLIDSVTVRGSIPGQAQYEPITGLSGPDLYEATQFIVGSLPMLVGSLGATGVFRLNLPLWFEDFGFGGDLNRLTNIPADKMSDLKLIVKIAAVATVDTGTGVFAFTGSPSMGVEVHQYYQETVPANFPYLRQSYEMVEDTNISTSTVREVRIAAGGDYSLVLMRAFSGANAKQSDTTGVPFTRLGTVRVDDLSLTPKEVTDFMKIRHRNLSQVLDSLVTGNAALVYSQGARSVFQTGNIGKALNYVKLTYDATAGAGSKVRFVSRRLFDDQNLLGIQR